LSQRIETISKNDRGSAGGRSKAPVLQVILCYRRKNSERDQKENQRLNENVQLEEKSYTAGKECYFITKCGGREMKYQDKRELRKTGSVKKGILVPAPSCSRR